VAKQAWYPLARQIEGLLSGSNGELARLHEVLDAMEAIVLVPGNRKNACLQICVMLSLRQLLNISSNDITLKTRVVSFVNVLYEDCQVSSSSDGREQEKCILLSTLYVWAQSTDIPLADLAKKSLKLIQQSDSHFWRSDRGVKMITSLQIPRNIDAILPNTKPLTVGTSTKPSVELLPEARKGAFPVEFMIYETRKQVEKWRREIGVDNDLSAYVPLDGAPDKHSTSDADSFELNSKIFEFIESEEDKNVLLLHGQAGSGKSLFGRYLERSLWAYYDKGGVVPLVISLPSLAEPTHHVIEQALADYGWSTELINAFKVENGPEMKRTGKDLAVVSDRRRSMTTAAATTATTTATSSGGGGGLEYSDEMSMMATIRLPRLVVILDGYDEIRTRENLYLSNRLMDWNAKVIITARTEYLDSLGSDYSSSFTVGKNGSAAGNGAGASKNAVGEIFIKPFTEKQISMYLTKIAKKKKLEHQSLKAKGDSTVIVGSLWSAEQYQHAIVSVPGISDLIQHPFILQIITEVLPILKKNQTESVIKRAVTRADVYELFIQQWFDREAARITLSSSSSSSAILPEGLQLNASFWEYALAVASFMYDKKIAAVKAPSPNYSRYEVTLEEGAHFFKEDDKKTQIARKGVPLKRAGVNVFGFIHKSILEFFAARAMYDDIMQAAQDGEPLNKNSVLNGRQIQEEPSVAKFFADMLNKREKDREALLSVVKLSRKLDWYDEAAAAAATNAKKRKSSGMMNVEEEDHSATTPVNGESDELSEDDELHKHLTLADKRDDDAKVRAAANAITVLVIDHYPFSRLNLSGIRIKGAILDFGNFYGTNLSNVDLSEVSLRSAILSDVNADGSNWNKVELSEPSSIVLDRFDNDVDFDSMIFTPDGSKCLSANKYGTLELWDAQAGLKLGCQFGYIGALVSFQSANQHPSPSSSTAFSNKKTKSSSSASSSSSSLNQLVALGMPNGRIGVWNYKTSELIWNLKPEKQLDVSLAVQELSWSSDGQVLISLHGRYSDDKPISQSMYLWDMKSGERLSVSSSNDDDNGAGAGGKKEIVIESISVTREDSGIKGKARYVLSEDKHYLLAIHETSSREQFEPCLWNLSNGEKIKCSQEMLNVISCSDRNINPFHLGLDGKLLLVQQPLHEPVEIVGLAKKGKKYYQPVTLHMFDMSTQRLLYSIDKVLVNYEERAQCKLNGSHLITCHGMLNDYSANNGGDGQNYKLKLWNVYSGKPVGGSDTTTIDDLIVYGITPQYDISAYGSTLITSHKNEDGNSNFRTLKVWDIITGICVHIYLL
jgi:hypothetical protein